jgi:hypothetical protein
VNDWIEAHFENINSLVFILHALELQEVYSYNVTVNQWGNKINTFSIAFLCDRPS